MENLAERKKLLNPLNYIGSDSVDTAEHIRIRVGTRDGDTSLSTSAVLVLSLENKTDADVIMRWYGISLTEMPIMTGNWYSGLRKSVKNESFHNKKIVIY